MLDDQDNSGSSLSPGRVLTPESRPMQSGKENERRVFIGNGGGLQLSVIPFGRFLFIKKEK